MSSITSACSRRAKRCRREMPRSHDNDVRGADEPCHESLPICTPLAVFRDWHHGARSAKYRHCYVRQAMPESWLALCTPRIDEIAAHKGPRTRRLSSAEEATRETHLSAEGFTADTEQLRAIPTRGFAASRTGRDHRRSGCPHTAPARSSRCRSRICFRARMSPA